MRRKNRMARLLRALSGKTQEQTGEEIGVHPSLIAQFERGKIVPDEGHLERLARGADLTVPDADEILRLADSLRQSSRWQGPGSEALLDELKERLGSHLSRSYRRLLTLRRNGPAPKPEDRWRTRELRERLKGLPEELRLAAVQVAEEFHNWTLCEAVCEESVDEASREVESAASWARVAREIAERVRGPEAWRNRLLGYAMAHEANALRVAGELKAAETTLEEAKRLWQAGSDSDGVLDPGRLLDLEGPLRTAQRRFEEALNLLEQARDLSRCPGRTLLMKGFTLEVMGEYERAIATLREAAPLLGSDDLRLKNVLRINLAVNLCHVGRYAEAAELVEEARPLTAELGDEITLIRLTWLRGRIAAGHGRPEEARRLLAQARQEFAARQMSYDVALALLEESVLLLDEGRTSEVKKLAQELTGVFESKGVHREALATLRVFQEAAEQEAATAEEARRLVKYLFRVRHDPGLRYEA
jgi:tetratricopeptide (TPR) repeat protein